MIKRSNNYIIREGRVYSLEFLTETMHLEKKNDQLSLSSKILTKLMRDTAVDNIGNLDVQVAVVVSGI